MPVYIFDKDALQRIADVEHEVLGADPDMFASDDYQDKQASCSFKSFLQAWNDTPHDNGRKSSDLFIPFESTTSSGASGSSSIYGYGGWHRYLIDALTGEIRFHLGFITRPAEVILPVLEKYGFRTMGTAK